MPPGRLVLRLRGVEFALVGRGRRRVTRRLAGRRVGWVSPTFADGALLGDRVDHELRYVVPDARVECPVPELPALRPDDQAEGRGRALSALPRAAPHRGRLVRLHTARRRALRRARDTGRRRTGRGPGVTGAPAEVSPHGPGPVTAHGEGGAPLGAAPGIADASLERLASALPQNVRELRNATVSRSRQHGSRTALHGLRRGRRLRPQPHADGVRAREHARPHQQRRRPPNHRLDPDARNTRARRST
jgi:hypothetical protein